MAQCRLMRSVPDLPTRIAGIPVPQDDISSATWRWAHRSLPDYLLTHSVRAYCWGATLAAGEGWSYDAALLWAASLLHDLGLTRIRKNTMCFEVEGAEIARRFLEGEGMAPETAERVAVAIILHMQPSVTLEDGVESVLLDRATSIDVRGADYAPDRGDQVGRHGGLPAPGVRPALPRRHPAGGGDPADVPERAAAARDGPGRMDGALALGHGAEGAPMSDEATGASGAAGATAPPEAEPYPPIEPYDAGMLDVGDGQVIYWETSGNPAGKPAIALHGGPGSGSTPGRRRWFDPDRYRIVQFDQRGCGRSTPHVGDLSVELTDNTTHHLIADIERLREHLGIERWLVWGASWGVTLALAYAERFPARVTEMVLLSITMTRRSDVRWFAHDTGRFFPEEWGRFRAGVPEAERDGDLVAAYDRLINGDADPAVRLQAVRDWVAWEDAILSLEDGYVSPHPRWSDERYMIAFARLVTHYFSHGAWLEEGEILAKAARLAGIPALLVHGRLDLAGPPDVAWALAQAWPDADLHFIAGGHTGDAEMDRLLLEATDRFAARS